MLAEQDTSRSPRKKLAIGFVAVVGLLGVGLVAFLIRSNLEQPLAITLVRSTNSAANGPGLIFAVTNQTSQRVRVSPSPFIVSPTTNRTICAALLGPPGSPTHIWPEEPTLLNPGQGFTTIIFCRKPFGEKWRLSISTLKDPLFTSFDEWRAELAKRVKSYPRLARLIRPEKPKSKPSFSGVITTADYALQPATSSR